MLFNSPGFILLFLPVVLVGFHALNRNGRTQMGLFFLVLSSFFFYSWWNPKFLLLILGSIGFNYAISLALAGQRRGSAASRLLLLAGVASNLILLGVFKYADFALQNISDLLGREITSLNLFLPLAISFFTFQQIAYLVDISRHEARPAGLLHYCLFVSFFPQLIAGPIVHHAEVLPQFRQIRSKGPAFWNNLAIGSTFVVIGLFKKVILAEKVGFWSNQIFASVAAGAEPSLIDAWVAMISFSLEIYFDFSGYSDIAIGLARMFGIKLPLNFASPYKAASIIEFWRQWHITLSRFLRDYLYYPLGGNRRGRVRRYANLIIVMALGGLWHGAGWTFLIWGLMHGAYLVVNHLWRFLVPVKPDRRTFHRLTGLVFSRLFVFLLVAISWVMFRADSFDSAMSIYQGLVGGNGLVLPTHYREPLGTIGQILEGLGATYGAVPGFGGGWQIMWLAGLLIWVWILPNAQELLRNHEPALNIVRRNRILGRSWPAWSPNMAYGVIFGIAGAVVIVSLLQGQPGEFIYFQF